MLIPLQCQQIKRYELIHKSIDKPTEMLHTHSSSSL